MRQGKVSQFLGKHGTSSLSHLLMRHKGVIYMVLSLLLLTLTINISSAGQINDSFGAEGSNTKDMNELFNSSLKIYYSFDYNSSFGNKYYDTINQSRLSDDNGELNWTTNGKYGGGIDIAPGKKGYVYIGNNSPTIEGYGEATLLVWVYPIANKSTSNRVFQKQFDQSWALMESSLKTKCYMNTTISGVSGVTSTIAANINQWNLMGCIYNGTHLTTYLNGQLSTSSALTGNIRHSTNEATIGAASTAFNGSLDEVMAFNKSLNASQLQYIYNGSFRKEIIYNLTSATLDTVDYYRTNRLLLAPNVTGSDTTLREIGNIIYDNGQYRHVYSGHTGAYVQNQVFVHWANSSDGITWEKQGKVIVNASEDPYLLYHNSTYWLYVEDKNVSGFSNSTLYTSNDFITWYSNGTFLTKGGAGAFDSQDASSPTPFFLPNQTTVMLYEGRNSTNNGMIGVAVSVNGKDFIKHQDNPFIIQGDAGQWDNDSIVPDSIYYLNGFYYITYHGTTTNAGRVWSGILRTNDLLNKSAYTRYSKNPLDTADTTMIVNISNEIVILREAYRDIEIATLNKSIINKTNTINTINDWLNITLTTPIFLTELQVNESWIYIKELRGSETDANNVTYNLTTTGNYLGTDLPVITSNNGEVITITSGMYLVNMTAGLDLVDCANIREIVHKESTQSFTEVFSGPSCQDQRLSLALRNAKTSTLTVDYWDAEQEAADASVNSLSIILSKWPTFAMIYVFVAIIMLLAAFAYGGSLDIQTILMMLAAAAVFLVFAGIILSISTEILNDVVRNIG